MAESKHDSFNRPVGSCLWLLALFPLFALAGACSPHRPPPARPARPQPARTGEAALDALLRACCRWTPAQARQQPAILCSTPEEPVPLSNPGLPALSVDGRQVALFITKGSCCADDVRVELEIRQIDGRRAARWELLHKDERGASRIHPVETLRRVRRANRWLLAGGFRPIPPVAMGETGLRRSRPLARGLVVRRDGRELVVSRPGGLALARLTLPRFERPPHCCGDGVTPAAPCLLEPDLLGLWYTRGVLVVAAGLVHQADGCETSPRFLVTAIAGAAARPPAHHHPVMGPRGERRDRRAPGAGRGSRPAHSP